MRNAKGQFVEGAVGIYSINWKGGKPRCLTCGKLISYYKTFCNKHKGLLGFKNPIWKGEEVSYSGMHHWVRKYKGKPKFCEHCKSDKKTDLPLGKHRPQVS